VGGDHAPMTGQALDVERLWALIRTYDLAIVEVAGYNDPRTAPYLARLRALRTNAQQQLTQHGDRAA
jgi:hypothetical protein